MDNKEQEGKHSNPDGEGNIGVVNNDENLNEIEKDQSKSETESDNERKKKKPKKKKANNKEKDKENGIKKEGPNKGKIKFVDHLKETITEE